MSVRTPMLPIRRALSGCVAVVEGVAFWTSVLVPLTYLPLLVAVAVGVVPAWILLAAVAAHALSLVAGHGYDRAGDAEGAPGGADR